MFDTHNDDTLPITNIPYRNKNKNTIIKVIGVGGGGGNALNNMFAAGIENVDFVIANTDIQVLEKSSIPYKIQLGRTLTEGLGAGNDPERGKNAAIESKQEITDLLKDNTKMVFVTAGMGGGTGTGAAPVIAQISKELDILTIGIVTLPFRYEGKKRIEQAKNGLLELKSNVDALIVIDNEKINEIYGDLAFIEAFRKADEVVTIAAKGIAEIITKPGLINVDFADVNSVMRNSGVALMGTGFGTGTDRAEQAVKQAISSPLLNNNEIRGAKNILVNIISPKEKPLAQTEINLINNYLQNKAGNNANLIWGVTIDETLEESTAAVTVVATGFQDNILESFEILRNNKNDNLPKILEDAPITPKTPVIKNQEEDIMTKIKNLDKKYFDFQDNDLLDEYEKVPAFVRQNKQINLSQPTYNDNRNFNSDKNNSNNSFLNPMMD